MKYVYFIFLVVAFGCQSVQKPEKPKDLIPKEKMIDIMMESYLSNAARSVNNRKLRSYGIKLDSLIYAKYNIDSLQLVKSNNYYSANLETYESMFKTIEEKLTVLKVKADSIQKLEKAKRGDNRSKEEKNRDSILEKSGLGPAINAASQDSIE